MDVEFLILSQQSFIFIVVQGRAYGGMRVSYRVYDNQQNKIQFIPSPPHWKKLSMPLLLWSFKCARTPSYYVMVHHHVCCRIQVKYYTSEIFSNSMSKSLLKKLRYLIFSKKYATITLLFIISQQAFTPR